MRFPRLLAMLLPLLILAACSAGPPPAATPPTPDACAGMGDDKEKDGGMGGTGHDEALCPDNAD